jgi:hypothetical protein
MSDHPPILDRAGRRAYALDRVIDIVATYDSDVERIERLQGIKAAPGAYNMHGDYLLAELLVSLAEIVDKLAEIKKEAAPAPAAEKKGGK